MIGERLKRRDGGKGGDVFIVGVQGGGWVIIPVEGGSPEAISASALNALYDAGPDVIEPPAQPATSGPWTNLAAEHAAKRERAASAISDPPTPEEVFAASRDDAR